MTYQLNSAREIPSGNRVVKGSENDVELERGVVTQHGEYTECYLAANF